VTKRRTRLLVFVKALAFVLVAAPAVGIAFLVIREGITEPSGMPLDRAFHLGLGVALLLLLADFVVAILRSNRFEIVLLLGTGGFLACLFGGLLAEVLGPPVLLVLLITGVLWAAFLARNPRAARISSALPHEPG
jgi:hypothetical protein